MTKFNIDEYNFKSFRIDFGFWIWILDLDFGFLQSLI